MTQVHILLRRFSRSAKVVSVVLLACLSARHSLADQTCYTCRCNGGPVAYADPNCEGGCKATLNCFTPPLCVAASTGTDTRPPTKQEAAYQKEQFPDLKCYGVVAGADEKYNCLASALGISDTWVWEQLDTDGNLQVDWSEVDKFMEKKLMFEKRSLDECGSSFERDPSFRYIVFFGGPVPVNINGVDQMIDVACLVLAPPNTGQRRLNRLSVSLDTAQRMVGGQLVLDHGFDGDR